MGGRRGWCREGRQGRGMGRRRAEQGAGGKEGGERG